MTTADESAALKADIDRIASNEGLGGTAAKERNMIVMAAFGGVIGLLGLMVLSSMWKGYVLTVLWAWFVVPTF